MHKFKIIALAENQINNEDILIAMLSIVKRDSLYEFTSLSQNYVFVFELNSKTAKTIRLNPEVDIYLNLSDFSLKRISFDDIPNSFGYFHKDLEFKIYNELSAARKDSYDLATSLTDCTFSCHPEMFFYLLYSIIFFKEFENQMDIIDEDLLFDRFSEVTGVILMDSLNVMTGTFKGLSVDKIDDIRILYYKEIDYINGYSLPVVLFVSNNETAKRISIDIMGEHFRQPNRYIKELFIKSLHIIEKRITINSSNKSFFAHEIVIGSDEVQLKIFPTLYAFTRFEDVAKLWDGGNLLIDYLVSNNFTHLKDASIDIKAKTKYIFSHPEIITPFYNDLSNSLSFYPFGRQKRNKVGECLLNQGQINFTLYK
jgi:hypothetical protein